jgi:hypothetical protein
MKRLRQIAAWLLMLALPLQGIAAYAPLAPCGDEHAAASQQAHDHDAQAGHHAQAAADHHAAAGQQHHDHEPANDASGHSCCHHVFTGAATGATPQPPEAPLAVIPRISLLNTLFIPELPQRPPRA